MGRIKIRVRPLVVDALRAKGTCSTADIVAVTGLEYMTVKACLLVMQRLKLVKPFKRGKAAVYELIEDGTNEVMAGFLSYQRRTSQKKASTGPRNQLDHMEGHDPSIEHLLRSRRMQPCLTNSPN